MIIQVYSEKRKSLDKKLKILEEIYISESSFISKYLNKRPDQYFKYLRLRLIEGTNNLVGEIYIDEYSFEYKNLVDSLNKSFNELKFTEVNIPFSDYKVLDEIIYRIFTKVNTPDVPYKVYLTRRYSESNFKLITGYLKSFEPKTRSNYKVEMLDNPIHDPMYPYKKAFILLSRT